MGRLTPGFVAHVLAGGTSDSGTGVVRVVSLQNFNGQWQVEIDDSQSTGKVFLVNLLNYMVNTPEGITQGAIMEMHRWIHQQGSIHVQEVKVVVPGVAPPKFQQTTPTKFGQQQQQQSFTPQHQNQGYQNQQQNNNYNKHSNSYMAPQPQQGGRGGGGGQPQQQQQSWGGYNSVGSSSRPENVPAAQPIASLTTFTRGYCIEVRVVSKGPIKTWNNEKGSGQLFNCEVMDQQGTKIRCTFFQLGVDKYYDVLEEDEAYQIAGKTVKQAAPNFANVNDIELSLDENAYVEKMRNSNVPRAGYNFLNIADLRTIDVTRTVDIIGCVKQVDDCTEIPMKNGDVVKKRDVYLTDPSNAAVRLTVWRDQAETFGANVGDVMVCRTLKINQYNGINLALGPSSSFKLNPQMNEVSRMQQWWHQGGSHNAAAANMLSTKGGDGPKKETDIRTVISVTSDQLGSKPEAADWFWIRGIITMARSDPPFWYTACPTCNKKVVAHGNEWSCSKCNQTYDQPTLRYVFRVSVHDQTGCLEATMFNEQGREFFGFDADMLHHQFTEDQFFIEKILREKTFVSYILKCKASFEQFTGTPKVSIVELQPVEGTSSSTDVTGEMITHLMECISNYN